MRVRLQVEQEKGVFAKLDDDFRYNLGLLQERDAELADYDARYAQVVKALQDK